MGVVDGSTLAGAPGAEAPGLHLDESMGLATLYAIVSQYGGCVTVTSEPGDTAFEILLPSPR